MKNYVFGVDIGGTTSVSSDTFLISTTSSDTRRCPRLISSNAASDLPIPLSPIISDSPGAESCNYCGICCGESSSERDGI